MLTHKSFIALLFIYLFSYLFIFNYSCIVHLFMHVEATVGASALGLYLVYLALRLPMRCTNGEQGGGLSLLAKFPCCCQFALLLLVCLVKLCLPPCQQGSEMTQTAG